MPDEIMKSFLEQIIDCCSRFSDALTLALEYYNVSAAEKEFTMEAEPSFPKGYGGDYHGKEK